MTRCGDSARRPCYERVRACSTRVLMVVLRFLIPNSFTALSLLLGLASVTRSAVGDFELAAWMVLWGVLLDKLDGTAARLLKSSSGFGAQFDSFADFVVFGIAPAALFFYQLDALGFGFAGPAGGSAARGVLLVVAVSTYVLATAGRLARFNITDPPLGDRIFYGIPTTMVGGLVAAAYLTWLKYELAPSLLSYVPFALIVFSALMCSSLRLPKLKVRKSMAMNVFQFGNVICAYILVPLRLMPEYVLGLAVLYTVGGVVWCLLHPPVMPPEDDSIEHGATA